ncbi:MAG: ISL3 family transposase [Rhodothermaceae bacterium]|nr:ISL3 family transposase [Rhodothermaceae bacterium]
MAKTSVDKSLGLRGPWEILEDAYDDKARRRTVTVTCTDTSSLKCPECDQVCSFYDLRTARQWRHLDTCTYQTIMVARLPRIKCSEHGVKTALIPWADPSSRYTHAFEAYVIGWAKEASILAVSRQLGIGWKGINGIIHRAVERGLGRRTERVAAHICVDEVSYKKRHKYLTIVSDAATGTVLYVGIGRNKTALVRWYQQLSSAQLHGIRSVSMDMWPAYIRASEDSLPNAAEKICFDRFHVAKCLGEAVDKVRRQEHKELRKEGNQMLTGSKYTWLKSPPNMSMKQKRAFYALRTSTLKTARAWAIKEMARNLWHYVSRTWALKGWKRWLSWAMRCRLEPVKEAAKTIKNHLWGIINAIILKVSNGPAESINSRIKTIKVRSRGFRNKDRFVDAIYFHLGGLDLSPGIRNLNFSQ